MGNSPFVHTDPDGDILPAIAVAAIVGGIVGAAGNIYTQYKNGNLNSVGDWIGAGVIGGVAGAAGAALGTVAIMGGAAFVAGGAEAAGATGVSVGGYTLGTTGFVSGAISGGVGGATSSILRQVRNTIAGWQDEFSFKELIGEAILGAGIGGIFGGAGALLKRQNFWWGNGTKSLSITVDGKIMKVPGYQAQFPDIVDDAGNIVHKGGNYAGDGSTLAAKGAGRVFTQTAKEGDLLFYSTKIGDDVIEFGGNFSKSNGSLTIKNFDIDGALTNKLGIRGIKDVITDFGRQQGVNQVIIQGAKRTTGANPGKIPSQLIFKIK